MTIEVTLEQVINDWVREHTDIRRKGPFAKEPETREYVGRLTDCLDDKDTAYLLIRLLHTVPTAQGRKAAIAQLREEEVI